MILPLNDILRRIAIDPIWILDKLWSGSGSEDDPIWILNKLKGGSESRD